MANCYSLNLLLLAVAFEAMGEHEKTIEICRGLLAALDQADLASQLKRKARQEAESRIKAASLKQLAAAAAAVAAAAAAAASAYPDATADSHPADSPQWHLDGINQDYPALAGGKNTKKKQFY
jgi:anti-sigma factor RsiW